MGQFLLHLLPPNCAAHSLCMIFPQHVYHMAPRPNRGSASRQIEQMSFPSSFSSTTTARAGAAALFASPADIKLAMFSAVRRGGLDPIPDWFRENSTLLYQHPQEGSLSKTVPYIIIPNAYIEHAVSFMRMLLVMHGRFPSKIKNIL